MHQSTEVRTSFQVRQYRRSVFLAGLITAGLTVVCMLRLEDVATLAILQSLANMLIFVASIYFGHKLIRFPSQKAVTRFWRVNTGGYYARFTADVIQIYYLLSHDVANPELQSPVSKAIYGVSLLLIAREFVFFPLAAKSRQEQTRLFLDLITVMISAAGFGWFFILAPSLEGPISVKVVGMAFIQFSLVLIYANLARLILSNTALLTRTATKWATASAFVHGISEAIVPIYSGTSLVGLIFVARVVAWFVTLVTIYYQLYDVTFDSEALQKKNKRPFSLVPYTAIGGLYGLLVFSLMRSELSVGTWGVVFAAVLSTGVVTMRQLLAFSENAALLQRLDDNLHELKASYDREQDANRRRAEVEMELRHVQKLDAIGRLAGGVAHELNTPVQYLKDNVSFLNEAFSQLTETVDGYRNGRKSSDKEQGNEQDVDYLMREVPMALHDTTTGLARVAEIVRSLKAFGGGDAGNMRMMCNVNDVIADTLVIARNEIDSIADVEFRPSEIPSIMANVRDLGQVWLSLLINSAHAIQEKGLRRGTITVQCYCEDGRIYVEVKDNGAGMTQEVADCVFDPFFTTKPMGVGSGQGLTMARSIIVVGHDGDISFTTELNVGTTFIVAIPTQPASPAVVSERTDSARS